MLFFDIQSVRRSGATFINQPRRGRECHIRNSIRRLVELSKYQEIELYRQINYCVIKLIHSQPCVNTNGYLKTVGYIYSRPIDKSSVLIYYHNSRSAL